VVRLDFTYVVLSHVVAMGTQGILTGLADFFYGRISQTSIGQHVMLPTEGQPIGSIQRVVLVVAVKVVAVYRPYIFTFDYITFREEAAQGVSEDLLQAVLAFPEIQMTGYAPFPRIAFFSRLRFGNLPAAFVGKHNLTQLAASLVAHIVS
jgi:hypothetical protein